MKLRFAAAASMAALISVNAFAAVDEAQMADFEADCKKYAQEDGVSAEEMEGYIAQCMQDLLVSQAETAGTESGEGESQE